MSSSVKREGLLPFSVLRVEVSRERLQYHDVWRMLEGYELGDSCYSECCALVLKKLSWLPSFYVQDAVSYRHFEQRAPSLR